MFTVCQSESFHCLQPQQEEQRRNNVVMDRQGPKPALTTSDVHFGFWMIFCIN